MHYIEFYTHRQWGLELRSFKVVGVGGTPDTTETTTGPTPCCCCCCCCGGGGGGGDGGGRFVFNNYRYV